MGVLDSVEVDQRPNKQLQLGVELSCGVILVHNPRCSVITSCTLLLFCTTDLAIDTGSEARAVRRTMAKKGELIPPCEPTQIQILSMPKDNGKDDDSGAESESEWETEEDEEEEEEEGQSSDSGLGSQGSGHCPRQSRECKGAARVLDRGPYDPTPLASFTSVEVEVGQRCRDWVTKITDPASRVSFIFIHILKELKVKDPINLKI